MKELTRIARQAVIDIGEVDASGFCLGNCKIISEEIKKRINVNAEYKEPFQIINGGFSTSNHVALYIPEKDWIIDTQVWQFTNHRTDIATRKVVFTRKEYKKLGLVI